MALHYYNSIGTKIDELIIQQQNECWQDDQCIDVDLFLSYQEQINKLSQLRVKSKDRAQGQIIYNELMVANYNKDNRRSKDLKSYVMITLNPREGTDPRLIETTCLKFQNLVISDWNLFCLEQRGDTENMRIHGVHAHMLLLRSRKPAEFLKEMHRLFDPLVGNPSAIVVKSCDQLSDVRNFLGYMQGKKDDPTKLPKVEFDKIFRKQYGFQDLYIKGTCPLLVGHVPLLL